MMVLLIIWRKFVAFLSSQTDIPVRTEESLIGAMLPFLRGSRHIAVGSASPIPAAAAFLSRELSSDPPRVTVLGSRDSAFFIDGGREMFDCTAQGRLDTFFLGGVQIDGAANINLMGLGNYPDLVRRFPGNYGSTYMYYTARKTILFTPKHSTQTLVPNVDYISATGTSPPNVQRAGGPVALVTNLCVFSFDKNRKRFRLESVHSGHDAEEVRSSTGFDYDVGPNVPETATLSQDILDCLRGMVAERLAATYPAFAAAVWGISK